MQEVFTAADPYQSQDKQVTAKELLDKAAERISNDLNQQPEVRAQLLLAIGKAYGSQVQLDLSIKYLEDALNLQQHFPSRDNVKEAVVLDNLGRAYNQKGSFTQADQRLSAARKLLEAEGRINSEEYLQTLTDSGTLAHMLNHVAEAREYYERGLNISRKLYGNHHPETASMLLQLAQVMTWQANRADAEKLTKEAVTIYHATLPEKHPERVHADISLGELLYRQGRLDEAETYLTNGLADLRAVFGENSAVLIGTYGFLGKIYLAKQHWDSAEKFARAGLQIAIHNFGEVNFSVGVAHNLVANILIGRKQYLEAEKEAFASLKVLQATASPDHQYTASTEYLLAASLIGQHRYQEAEPMLQENIARWTRAQAPSWRIARSESLLGVVLFQLQKKNEAKQLLLHADEVLSAKDSGAFPDDIAVAHKRAEQFQQCVKENRVTSCTIDLQ